MISTCVTCAMFVISHMISWLWFPYVEEFSILPCPACPTCRCYISVGLSADTLRDTLACQVSKFGPCIRYDGWTVTLGMWEVNIANVRFSPCSLISYLGCVLTYASCFVCTCVTVLAVCVCRICVLNGSKYRWVRSMRSWRCFWIHGYVLCIPSAFDVILIELCVFDMCDM